jgi:hypothetical protein
MMLQYIAISVLAEGEIIVPIWVLSIALGLIASLLTTWGILQATKANLEVRAKRNEEDIRCLQQDKVNKAEFEIVYTMLRNIDKKLDEHISQD